MLATGEVRVVGPAVEVLAAPRRGKRGPESTVDVARLPLMTTRDEISSWLLQRVEEIEGRYSDPADPHAEEIRQLAASLRYAMSYAQELTGTLPAVAESFFKYAAKPFSQHQGYDAGWDPSSNR
jgi:hypothetical protein